MIYGTARYRHKEHLWMRLLNVGNRVGLVTPWCLDQAHMPQENWRVIEGRGVRIQHQITDDHIE